MKATILYGDNIFSATYQTKSFENESRAIEWIRRNRKKVWSVNHIPTRAFDHFELMDALMKGEQ